MTPLLFWCRTIPYQISSLNQMTFSRVWTTNFVLIGAGSSWQPKGVAQDGMWILLIQPGGWLLYKGLNYGGCTLRPSTTFQVSERDGNNGGEIYEHCTGIARVMGSNPVQTFFFRFSFASCFEYIT